MIMLLDGTWVKQVAQESSSGWIQTIIFKSMIYDIFPDP